MRHHRGIMVYHELTITSGPWSSFYIYNYYTTRVQLYQTATLSELGSFNLTYITHRTTPDVTTIVPSIFSK